MPNYRTLLTLSSEELAQLEEARIELMKISGERMLAYFTFAHLNHDRLKAVSAVYCRAALATVVEVESSAERTVALRKILEGKDAAVRAAL